MRLKLSAIAILLTILLISCKSDEEKALEGKIDPKAHKVEVVDVLQAGSYTYIQVDDYGDIYWVAVTKREVEKGDICYYIDSMEMQNFESKDLGKTFDKILFIDDFRTEPFLIADNSQQATPPGSKKSVGSKLDISIDKAENGITIAELYADKDKFSGKQVIIRGQVTKFNEGIMGRNWVHLQDGTYNDGQYDITLTTDQVFTVGDVVTVEGTAAINQDFGFGYSYEVLLENTKKL